MGVLSLLSVLGEASHLLKETVVQLLIMLGKDALKQIKLLLKIVNEIARTALFFTQQNKNGTLLKSSVTYQPQH